MFLQHKSGQALTGSEVVLRKATNQEAPTIERLHSICFEDEYDENKMLMPEEEEKNGMRIYIVEVNNEIIGKIHLEVSTSIAGIYGLGVLPEYRRKGYGRAILARAVEMLKEENFSEVMLQVEVDNANALNLYRSCGFEVVSTMDYYVLSKKS